MNKEEKLKRYIYLKEKLEKVMPSVILAIGMNFTPANSKMLESMAQEFWQLKSELSI